MPLWRPCGRRLTKWTVNRAGTPRRPLGRRSRSCGSSALPTLPPIVAVRVNEDSFIVLRAEVPTDDVIDVTIAIGPDGTRACRVSTTDGHLASAARDVRAFEQILASRLADDGMRGRTGADPG